MNKHFILLSAAAVLLFSCIRESDQEVIRPGETITFTASWAGSDDTRTILQPDGTSVWWESGAQVNVFFSDKASGKFTSTNSQAQAIVDFQGSLPIVVGSVETENPPHAYWAVYPYDAANTCDGESVTLTVPTTQTATEGTFANKKFPSIATSTNFYLAFYNICGGVRFTVANEGITSVTFKANNEESLAGKIKVRFDSVPVVMSVIEGTSEVVVNAPTGGFIPGKYYFATLLPQTLTKGVSLTFTKSDGKVASTSLDNSITINRSRFGKMDEKDKGLEFTDDGSGPNPSDNIVFADDRLKAKLVSAFDTNGDGELCYGEAAEVTSIDGVLTIKTYTSFDEFRFFTGVTSIPDSYFKDWTKLTSISLPTSIAKIGRSAFSGCSALNEIVIPEGIAIINQETFRDCSKLISVNLPVTLTQIGSYAFASCSNLASITIPENVTTIGASAFELCSSIKEIVIPSSVTTIQGWAFSGCVFDSIIVEAGNKKYDSRNNCNAIIETSNNTLIKGSNNSIIPEGVTTISRTAFSECIGLKSIVIPETVSSMEYSAFANCTSLISVVIPESLSRIENQVFMGCSSLIDINIPESISSIGGYAFCGCSSLASIIIPDSVSRIEFNSFQNCTSLSNIVFPEGLVSIGRYAFQGCSKLSSIDLPDSLTEINDYAFDSCSSLTSVTVKAIVPPQGGYLMFSGSSVQIYVPSGSVDAYKSAQYWKDYASRIQAIQE